MACRAEQGRRLGNHLPPLLSSRVLEVNRNDPLALCRVIGEEIEGAADVRNVARLRGELGHERAQAAPGIVAVENAQLGFGSGPLRDGDHDETAVLTHDCLECPLGLLGGFKDDLVFALLRPELVESDLLGRGRFEVLGTGRGPVDEPVVEARPVLQPGCARVLGPVHHIRAVPAGRHLTDAPGHPVRPRSARGVDQKRPVLCHIERRHGDRAVHRQLVRVKEDSSFVLGALHHVEDVLVLKAAVAQLEPAPASLKGGLEPRIVPQLREAPADFLARLHLGEPLLGELVLGVDPGLRLRGVRVLEPTVGIGHELAVVIVNLVGAARRYGRMLCHVCLRISIGPRRRAAIGRLTSKRCSTTPASTDPGTSSPVIVRV